MQYTQLKNGKEMPVIGFGTYKTADAATEVKNAVQAGYRLIDTAAYYGNETAVGEGLRQSGAARQEIFLTSKVWNDRHGYDQTMQAFEESLHRLGTDYLDLYLIHWPKDKNIDTWRALETLYRQGRVKAIGVSNFKERHLEEILEQAEIPPMVNQVEYHPLFQQKPLKAYCDQLGIRLQAYSPLMRGEALKPPLIQELAQKYGKTPAQIVLRWDIQNGVVPIPKSSDPQRMKQNLDVLDFALEAPDMARISALDQGRRLGADPDNIDF